jgi:hypothetical protein
MIQICDDTLVTPLSIIYTNCIKKGVFPKLWKMANVVPVYKKENKQLRGKVPNERIFFTFANRKIINMIKVCKTG